MGSELDPLAPMRANMREFYRLLGAGSPGGSMIEHNGLLAAIVPSCPERSFVNAVVFEDARTLAEARDELARAYEDAGVSAWTVWVPEADRETARLLERAGHVLDASPRAMTLSLADNEPAPAPRLDWEQTDDIAAIAALNERAYGWAPGEFAGASSALGEGRLWLYLARQDGEPASCVGALDAGTDCGIYLVATDERVRGLGLASALMRQALVDARKRGRKTSSLQATKLGRPMYERLGYVDRGSIEMWELRAG